MTGGGEHVGEDSGHSDNSDIGVDVKGHLSPDEVADVTRIVNAATEVDGVRPISEHVMLHLRYGGEAPARNVLLRVGPDLAAYAHLDITDVVEGPSAEIVVDPAFRGRGHGHRLVEACIEESHDGRLRLWAHGETSGAAELARSMGFVQMRTLWQMRRSLYAALPDPELPPGVRVRTFRPGEDDLAWVDLNARAFVDHPEQGVWTVGDLQRRMQEPWFDPAGFFLAERDSPEGPRLVAFHWTKIHGAGAHHGIEDGPEHGHDPIGEVYVVGVDPAEQGQGLGRAMTLVGLHHLRAEGLGEAMLYVEADNEAAIRVYSSLGFTHWDTDRMFHRPRD